jgi:hypothetical protein
MKNKKWLVILIVAFPSLFWLILETSNINSRKLPFYGSKKIISKNDTLFQIVNDAFCVQKKLNEATTTLISKKLDFPLYAIVFISPNYRIDSYRLTGLWEYLNYKKSKIEHIPFVLVTEFDEGKSIAYNELKKLSNHKNVNFYTLPKSNFDSICKTHFNSKPYYIDYSFFILVDKKRNIRGYYDGRYVSEIKRLIEEYQHLRLKEEKQKLIEINEIKKNS